MMVSELPSAVLAYYFEMLIVIIANKIYQQIYQPAHINEVAGPAQCGGSVSWKLMPEADGKMDGS